MKSKITKKENKIKYPCLMICEHGKGSVIILAYKEIQGKYLCGTLLHNSFPNEYILGEYTEDWIKNDFALFEGAITLSN